MTVLHRNCLDGMRLLAPASVDAIVTDPPYGLGFMGKKWDTPGALVERKADTTQRWDHVGGNHNPANSQDAQRTRLSEGRKFQTWCEGWSREALRVAKPGAHLLAFGGTRMFHRLTCAIEDAGWEIRDCLSWLYGSGFPKSHNGPWGGTALKPAWEPIILARKPLVGTVAQNVAGHGTGALNIDACRIGTADTRSRASRTALGVMNDDSWQAREVVAGSACGRWPANVVLDEAAAAILDKQSGTLTSGKAAADGHRRNSDKFRHTYSAFEGQIVEPTALYGDTGGASRFFYCAKASRKERGDGNSHPTVKPLALMRWLVRLVTPPGGLVLDPFAGSGTTGVAAIEEGFRFLGYELEAEYAAIAQNRLVETLIS